MLVIYLIAGVTLAVAHAQSNCALDETEGLFDCFPEPGSGQESCEARGCCWRPQPKIGRPYCTFPKNVGRYKQVNSTATENGYLLFLEQISPSGYPGDVPLLRLEFFMVSDSILRFKISDPVNSRFESPYPKINLPEKGRLTKESDLSINFDPDKFGFKISRTSTGEALFDAQNLGALVFANQFIEISSRIPNKIFGVGEHRTNISLDINWQKYVLFNNGDGVWEDHNGYGSHPFYLAVSPSGKSHGVFLHNSNAMDIIFQPYPAVTFRTIGGILDFYIFAGPSPSDVIRQYTDVVGRPYLPPYWSMGFHLCKYGYGSTNNTREAWQRNRDAKIPFDGQWNDIDMLKEQNDFTIDPERYAGIEKFVDDVHAAGMRYVVILDPGISGNEPAGSYAPYDDGLARDIFVKKKDGSILKNRVWNPVSTVFPDWTHPDIQNYWSKHVAEYHEKLAFDGLWIDMNEPACGADGSLDGCEQDDLENPPYVPVNDHLSRSTICMNARQAAGWHYDLHNTFAVPEAEATQKALINLGKRPFVLSRATFSGSGKYTAHWSGDVLATWHDLQKSIQELLTFSMYGVSFMGTDICGFRSDTTPALCNRWSQLGAFYTFARNHNDLNRIDKDPASFDKEIVDSIRKALTIRYSLLPHLYTLLYKAHVYGDTVARPLFFEFPDDEEAYNVELAFLWGSGLYIIPVTEENATSVEAYIPKGIWFDWYSVSNVIASDGMYLTLDAPFDTIPLLIRGGTILPLQTPAVTTKESRQNGFTFVVALDESQNAVGDLYWDDGEVIDPIENDLYGMLELKATGDGLTSTVLQWKTNENPRLEKVIIRNLSSNVDKVTINDVEVPFEMDVGNHVLVVENLNISMSENIVLKIN